MNQIASSFSAPIRPDYRGSGVLLHVTSLPSKYGIGDLGPQAFTWVDQLAAAAQSWWQVLPLGPTGYGHSPYQALSSFAGNPLVISPDRLVDDGLLTAHDCAAVCFPTEYVDFDQVVPFKQAILARAWENFQRGVRPDLKSAFEQFCSEKHAIHSEPALFMALRAKFNAIAFTDWPAELVRREPRALAKARRQCAEQMDLFRFGQFILLRQWSSLKAYANQRGIRILGDLPIFVSPDSADVWANPEIFLVDQQLKPTVVAGVPPDYFSADGQRWGNPIYNWDTLKQTNYCWWIDRLRARLDYLDAIRLDHFRGFEAAWHIPHEAPTAATGQWIAGPGADFFSAVRDALGALPFLAEDLGMITPAVSALLDQFQLPGMRVLQFGFSGDANNPHLPHHCPHNCVVYTGTHDNDTTRGWYDLTSDHERQNFWGYLQRAGGGPQEAVWQMIRMALNSEAALAIVPFQDILGLGSAARMNIPGRSDGQWHWRCSSDALSDPAWHQLSKLTQETNRESKASP